METASQEIPKELTRGYKANKRWRLKHPETRYKGKKNYYIKGRAFAVNRGQCWTRQDEKLIIAQDRPNDRILAKKLGRSIFAIQRKRSNLK